MPTLNLNTSPYFDDYQQQLVDNKDYVRVLFRPGFAVQARELTQLQSMMQQQVTRFGSHIFKDGSIVQNGEIKFINNYDSITIEIPTGRAIADYENRIITGATTGVKASVVSTDGINRLFLNYLDEGAAPKPQVGPNIYTVGDVLEKFIYSDNVDITGFDEELDVLIADNPGQTQEFSATLSGVSFGSAVSIVAGVYYVDGIFTRVQEQTLILDINDPTPSFRVGFELQSSVVTSNEDSTLVDNSRGTTNTGAPGANRLENKLLLAKRDLDASPDEIFLEVVRIINGIPQEPLNNPLYADLLTTFARRTFDESGNYALDPFLPSIQDHTTDTSKFVTSLSPSKAYVRGYEIETVVNTDVNIDRARETVNVPNFKQAMPVGNYFELNAFGSGDISDIPLENSILYLRTSDDETRGYAHVRGYDKINARLYVYDVRLLVKVPVEGDASSFTAGDVIRTRRGITGTVATIGSTDVGRGDIDSDTDNLYLTNVSGSILSGDAITSQTDNSITDEASANAIIYRINSDSDSISKVASVDSAFNATINGALQGAQTGLVYDTQREIKTSTFGNSRDNDFLVIGVGSVTGTEQATTSAFHSGIQDADNARLFRVDDGQPINKNLLFRTQIHSIHRTTGRNGTRRNLDTNLVMNLTGVGYGWALEDRELSLQYPDIYRVYAIYDSGNPATVPIADRLNLQDGAGTFSSGDMITGATSNAKAFVIRGNISGGNIEVSTRNNRIVEILITSGSFSAGEDISADTTTATLNITNHFTKTTHVNIAGSYNLDDGQRLDYYDTGRLVRKPTAPVPQGQIMVVVSRWQLTSGEDLLGGNHYYNVDSYPTDDAGFFNTDPRFNTSYFDLASPFARATGTNLRNAIDFRRRVTSREITDGTFTINPFSFADRRFVDQTFVVPDSTFTFEFDYYIPRRDKIIVDQFGNFTNIAGISGENPKFPESPENIMTLNTIDIPAYTRYIEDVVVTTINNRRYTMKDIGDLDKRLRNVETAISLTALESNVFNASVTDDENRQRFKSGFVTDDFVDIGATAGDFNNIENNIAYDTQMGLMQPAAVDEMWRMREQNPNAASRTNAGYVVNGGLATLPYEEIQEANRLGVVMAWRASECLRINPHAVWIFGGEITLTPNTDFWDTIQQLEPVVQSYQDASGNIINGPFTLSQVPADVQTAVRFGRNVNSISPSTTTTTSRTIGRSPLFRVRLNQSQVRVTSRTTSQTTRTVREGASDITSSRVVGGRVVSPATETVRLILPKPISFTAIDFKPNSVHEISFGGVDISSRVGDAAARTTDAQGTLSGSFIVNGEPGDMFFSGNPIIFKVGNDTGTSTGETTFQATHTLELRQNDIVSTRAVIPGGRILSQSSSNSVSSSSRVVADEQDNGGGNGNDPIAQSFFISDDIFATSIDIRMCIIEEGTITWSYRIRNS